MFKKIFCLALALVMMMGMAAVGFSAAQVEVADVAADADAATTGADADTASQGADADAAATGADDGVIYFDAASAGWSGVKAVSFYIYGLGGEGNITEWGGKNKEYTSNDGDTWAFKAKDAGVQEGHEYGIIFENLSIPIFNILTVDRGFASAFFFLLYGRRQRFFHKRREQKSAYRAVIVFDFNDTLA